MKQRIDIATRAVLLAGRFYFYGNAFNRHPERSPNVGVEEILDTHGHWKKLPSPFLTPIYYGEQIERSDIEGLAEE